MSNPNGYILYEGPSLFTGDPIVAIITGFQNASSNKKTGPMLQVFIIAQDMSPTDVLKLHKDSRICGYCKYNHQVGDRQCYVEVGRSVNSVYHAYKRGSYGRLSTKAKEWDELLQNSNVRFGAYGDPAAVPITVWQDLIKVITKQTPAKRRWTAYTHAWKTCNKAYRDFCMASVDTPEEYEEAHAKGWSTFRVRLADDPLQQGEFVCPASEEAIAHRTKLYELGKIKNKPRNLQCDTCLRCSGTFPKQQGVAIIAHGTKWKVNAYVEFRVKGEVVNA